MTKQEFLAMSLPYDLKVYIKYTHKPDNTELETMVGIVDDRIITNRHEDDIEPTFISNYGLCLHPLSDITKPIEHKGETFKPSFVLSRDFENADDFIYLIVQILNKEEVNLDLIKVLEYCPLNVAFKLIKWHFDIAGLIEKGEAVDVNTLPENPYK